ncbi:hypothetical protein [Mesorhizobium sp.]|nr:hypothetical protein [Mesorhizobium sp.]
MDKISAHGTHVGGIAGANMDGAGVMGVAFRREQLRPHARGWLGNGQ